MGQPVSSAYRPRRRFPFQTGPIRLFEAVYRTRADGRFIQVRREQCRVGVDTDRQVDQEMLFEIILAANYLDIKPLL